MTALPQDTHPEDIKAMIRKRGGTMAALAREAGVSKQNISAALVMRSSERVERLIADFLGVGPHTLWPSRYRGTTRIHLVERRAAQRTAA